MSERRSRSRKKKRRGLKIFLFLVLMLFVGAGAYVLNVVRHVDKATDEVYESVEGVDPIRGSAVTLGEEQPISILLLGVDTGDLGRVEQGRSDSMMVATINPNTGKAVLISIPRDTYTEIVGYGTMDKINHAYAFGGTAMAINSVQNLLNIPIDYYVTVNMAGIKEIVDSVGGIDIVSPLTFNQEGYQFNQGETVHLDGDRALAFARMRYEDPAGDTGRQARQRLVIEGVINKVISPSTLLNYTEILGSLSNNVQTNFQTADYLQLQSNKYLSAARNLVSEQIGGSGGTLEDGIYYHFIPEEELMRVQSLLRSELELD
ncbi:transcriptional attenuator, LytR family [Trichococcus flocculiformis]|uniref:LCP family glycopolymer transferase n=1 Tax=Trichococcus TaxID=82802 RepID=UPI0007A83A2A|nr:MULTISPECIES: LCP family protein [Trichococcus]CZR09103.1 Hypothetical protein TES5_2658 [Trichococcus sp. ES5]SHG25881.1 transcriptional attenuator, LytR family [Trichococcus flocculiformis]